MRVLFDIGHPGHVHLFKNVAHNLKRGGDEVLFTVRDKEHEIDLLKSEGLPYIRMGRHYSSGAGKIWGLVYYNFRVLFISLRFSPDMYMSHGSIYTLLSTLILRKPNIALEDSGNDEQVRLYLPFSRAVITSTSFPFRYGAKQILYEGYHETAYLHPNYFRADESVTAELGLKEGERYFIVRFVAWNATHDRKNSGLTAGQKREIVDLLSLSGRVFISSEAPLPEDLRAYRLPLRPERIHHALSFATLFVGEGATMASESAVLGTYAVYINTIRRGYLEEQEREYGLVSCFTEFDGVIEKLRELLDNPALKSETKRKGERLIKEKCDLTEYLTRFITEWPDSYRSAQKELK